MAGHDLAKILNFSVFSLLTRAHGTDMLAVTMGDGADNRGSMRQVWEVPAPSCSAADHPDGLPADPLPFSLRAGTYLPNTRTAACLWIKENPTKAEGLLADEPYRCGCLSPFVPVELKAVDSLTECPARQVAATHTAIETTRELFVAPEATGCEAAATALGKQLSDHISALMATAPE